MQTASFKSVQVTNHKKEPKADFNACLFDFQYNFSHIYAPTNGHKISPKSPNGQITIPKNGSTITPIISQIIDQ